MTPLDLLEKLTTEKSATIDRLVDGILKADVEYNASLDRIEELQNSLRDMVHLCDRLRAYDLSRVPVVVDAKKILSEGRKP